MTKIGFYYKDNDNSYVLPVKMEFEISHAPTIEEIHGICRKFVFAMGFTETAVDKVFGENDQY